MPVTIDNINFVDIYGNNSPTYKFNAGDYVKAEINIGITCTIISSLSNQITYSALTGEVTINEGSWYEEGFRVGDSITFLDVSSGNVVNGTYALTITAIPTDKTIRCTGLPNANNQLPGSNIWVFYKNSTKDEIELNLNYLPISDVSQTPSMSSLIDSETIKLSVTSLQALAVSGSLNLTQIGNKSAGFSIDTATITRQANSTFANATKYNYLITLEFTDNGVLFQNEYLGTECLKFVFKLIGKQNIGDTNGQELYYYAGSNSGWFNEAYNSEIPVLNTFPVIQPIYYNIVNNISFSFFTKSTAPNNIEIGSLYFTNDSNYNHNKLDAQNKFLALLKTGLINNGNIGQTFTSEQLPDDYYNLDYTVKLVDLKIQTVGAQKLYNVNLEIDFNYTPQGTPLDSFGHFLESRGIGEQGFYLWLKCGNTNALVCSGQAQKQLPVGSPYVIETKYIINHDNNFNYDNTFSLVATGDTDINDEDDLAFLCDIPLDTDTINYDAINIYLCANTSANTDEIVFEQMSFDLQGQDWNNFVNIFQNVANDLPVSSAKKIAMLRKVAYISPFTTLRVYYPFLCNWKYWQKQLNATAYFKSLGLDTKRWSNYTDTVNGYNTYVKIGFVHDGVEDYDYKQFRIWTYDESPDVTSTIELIDLDTLAVSNNIIEGKNYKIRATHVANVGTWDFLNCWGQITIEEKESQPRDLVSNEIDADLNKRLIANQYRRLNMTLSAPDTIILECDLDSNLLNSDIYSISSKISNYGTNNNPIFVNKLTESGLDKILESGLDNKIKE